MATFRLLKIRKLRHSIKIENLKLKIGFLGLILIAGGFFYFTQKASASWFNENWLYRKSIAIANSGILQTNFQVSFTLDTATLITAGKMKSDCTDIRVTDQGGNLLPYWIEENNPGCNSTTTKIWTKIPFSFITGSTIYVYYGNSSATDAQNGSKVFEFFDDFKGASVDTQNRWNTSGSPTISTGVLSLLNGSKLVSKNTLSTSDGTKQLVMRAKTASTSINTARLGFSNTSTLTTSYYNDEAANIALGSEETYLAGVGGANLVSHHKLEETTSTDANQFKPSGYFDTGKLGQAVSVYGNAAGTTGSTLTFNRGAQISGNNYEHINGNQGTISLWIKPSAVTTSCSDPTKYYFASSIGNPKVVIINQCGTVYFQVIDSSGVNHYVQGSGAVMSVGNWYHLVGIWNANNTINGSDYIDFFINGTRVTSVVPDVSDKSNIQWTGFTPSNTISIGSRSDGSYPSQALIDDFAVFDRVLSSAEITSLYNSGTGATVDIVADSSLKFYAKMDGSGTLAPVTYNGGASASKMTRTSSELTGGTNLIADGNMEAGNLNNWTVAGWMPTPSTLEKTSTGVFADTQSLHIIGTGPNSGVQQYPITVPANANYHITGWFKGNSGGGQIQVVGDGDFSPVYCNPTQNNVWQYCDVSFKTTATQTYVAVYLFAHSGEGWFDNVVLTPNLVDNGGMEGTYSGSGTLQTAPGWTTSGSFVSGTDTLAADTGTTHSGSESQKIVKVTTTGGSMGIAQTISSGITTGNYYLASVWVYLSSTGGSPVTLQVKNTSGATEVGRRDLYTATGSWVKLSTVVKAIDTGLNVFVWSPYNSTGTLYIDDFSLTPLDNTALSFKSWAPALDSSSNHNDLSIQGALTGIASGTGKYGNAYTFDGSTGYLRQKTYATNIGTLTYDIGNKILTDDGQSFTSFKSSNPATYMIVITNSDNTVTWGYIGSTGTATQAYVFNSKTLGTAGWLGQDPTSKTPVGYEIRKTDYQITGAITVGAWVKRSNTGYQIALSKGATGLEIPSAVYYIGFDSNNYPFANLPNNVAGTQAITDTNWHYIVASYTPSTSIYLYFDGNLIASKTTGVSVSITDAAGPFNIGTYQDNHWGLTFGGTIDSPFVLNTALTAAQIQAMYNAGSVNYGLMSNNAVTGTWGQSTTAVDTAYHTFAITQLASSSTLSVDGGTAITNSTNSPDSAQYVRLENLDAANSLSVDYVYVAKTYSTAPSTAVSATEEQGPGPVGYWKFDDGQGIIAKNSTWQKTGTTTNLISNPSLETNSTGWTLANGTGVVTTRDTTTGLLGSSSIKAVFDGTTDVNYGTPFLVTGLSGSTKYTASFYLKTSNMTKWIGIEWQDSRSYTYGATSGGGFSGTQDWTRVSLTFTTPSDGTGARIFLRRYGGNGVVSGTAWADGFQLEQNASATLYCDGSLSGSGKYAWNGTTNASTSTCTYGSDGEINGATWVTEDQCISGKCLSFDGGDYVDASNSKSLQITNAITMSAWVNISQQGFTDTGWGPTIIDKNDFSTSPQTDLGYYISVRPSTYGGTDLKPFIRISNGWGVVSSTVGTTLIKPNTWYNIAGTYDGSNIKIYVNGVLETTTSYTGGMAAAIDTFQIGKASAGGSRNWNGYLDEVKVYPYARTAAQIKTDYLAGKAAAGSKSGTSAALGAKPQDWMSNGLVGYWKMDENTGTSTLDSSENGNTLTLMDGATWSSGKYGSGSILDGLNDRLQTTTYTPFEYRGTGGISGSIWFNPDVADTGTGKFIAKPWTGMGEYNYHLSLNLNRTISLTMWDPNKSTDIVVTSTLALGTGTWYNITYTIDNTNAKIYVNGSLWASSAHGITNWVPAINENLPLTLGCTYPYGSGWSGNASYCVQGIIDDVRIYNRALSPKEVSDLYNWAPGPVGYWKMDDKVSGNAKTLIDSSGYGYNGTTNNGGNSSGMDCTKPGKIGGGCSFDGNDYVSAGSPSDFEITGEMTIEFWVKPQAQTGNWTRPISKGGYLDNGWTIFTGVVGDNKFYPNFGYNGTGGWSGAFAPAIPFQLGQWQHIAATVKLGSVGKSYLNGILVGSQVPSVYYPGTIKKLTIGGEGSGNFLGDMDDVKIYNYARTQSQILADMGTGQAQKQPLGYWKMDEGYGTTANNSGNGGSALNGTISGATWTNSGKFDKAITFDGSTSKVSVGNISNYLNLQSTTPPSFSVSAWFNVGSGYSSSNSLSGIALMNGSQARLFVQNSSLPVEFGFQLKPGSTAVYSPSNITSGTWNHLVGVYDNVANQIILYVNGVRVSSTTPVTTDLSTQTMNMIIGNAQNYFNGSIDEVKIYNYALTADDVKTEYNHGSSLQLGSLGNSTSAGSVLAAGQEYCIPGDLSACTAPVARWDFEEKTGGTVNDSSGNNNTGTWNGTGTHWATGKVGAAGKFNGVNDYVNVSSSTSLDTAGPTTLEAWINPSSLASSDGDYRIIQRFGSPSYTGYYLRLVNNNKIGYGSFGNDELYTYTGSILNKWTHLTAVYASDTTRYLYINGVLVQTITGTNKLPLTSSNTLYIGSDGPSAGFFPGSIDQMRIFNYARTAAQVAYDYNRGAPIGWWKMDECQGTTAHDSSGNTNNGTITIGATGTQTSAGTCTDGLSTSAWNNGKTGKRNASMSFDGIDDFVDLGSSTILNVVGATAMSASAWVKTSVNSGSHVIVGRGNDWRLEKNDSTYQFEHRNASNNIVSPQAANSSTGWVHVVGTYDINSGFAKLYLNGVQVDSRAQTGPTRTGTGQNQIGNDYAWHADTTYNDYWWNGQLDDVQIFNYALTGTQVKTLYNGGAVNFGN